MAQQATWGRRIASSSSRRRSPSRFSSGSQRASPSSTWGSQRPRAIRLRAQRCRWVHQRRSSASSGCSPDRGRRLSHSAAAPGSRARPSTRQGHHTGSLGIGSPACNGRPLQLAAPFLRRPLAAWLRLGRVRAALAGRSASAQRSCSSSQSARADSSRLKGWSGAPRSGVVGSATRQVSAHSSRRPPAPAGGNSQVACSRLMVARDGVARWGVAGAEVAGDRGIARDSRMAQGCSTVDSGLTAGSWTQDGEQPLGSVQDQGTADQGQPQGQPTLDRQHHR